MKRVDYEFIAKGIVLIEKLKFCSFAKNFRKRKKMKTFNVKSKSFALISIALLMLSAIVMVIPVKAQTGVSIGTTQTYYTGGPVPAGVTPSQTLQTIPYMSFSPNPIGVGQDLLVNIWTQPALDVNRAHTGYTVVITKPDGTAITVGPMVSYEGDTTAWFTYVPDTVGNYTIQFFFAGDYYPAGNYTDGIVNNTSPVLTTGNTVIHGITSLFIGTGTVFNQDCYYAPSQTIKYTFVVQQNQVSSWPASPLPTNYWSRPISPDNREWWVIGGNDPNNEVGLGTGTPGWPDNTNVYTNNYNFVPYTTGPTSAHVVWRQQGTLDGIVGGAIDGAPTLFQAPINDFSGTAFLTDGNAGPGFAGNPNIVFEGRCYQVITEPFNGFTQPVWTCFDIQTGKIFWQLTNVTRIPTLITYATATPYVPGAFERADRTVPSLLYLGASAVSGTGLVTEYNPMTGAVTLNVTIPFTSGTMYADPSVLSVQNIGTSAKPNYRLINWTLDGLSSSYPFSDFVNTNVTWPFASIGTADYESMISTTIYSAINGATGTASTGSGSEVYIAAANLLTGQLLWNVSSGVGFSTFTGNQLADHGMIAIRFDDGYWYAWNLHTGTLAWKSQLSSYPWGTFGSYASESANGLLYYGQYDGVVAYNWTNGKVAWNFQAPSPPFETPYTNGTGNLNGQTYSFFSGGIISGGLLYTFSIEHSPSAPLSRGWSIYGINATTGALVWSTLGPMEPGVVSDGYMTATNFYDGFMYVFGMGLSSTTVSAPQTQITAGQNAIISGSVLDQSPAQPGTPAVSDASMGDWMAYLHQQAPYPTNVTGVPVSIDAVDPNGNPVHIATVTSNSQGTFGYTWTPTIPGQYTITATFAGDDSYSFSSADTYATVVVPTTTPAPTTTTQPSNLATTSDLAAYIIGVGIAIIIAIAIAVLILRKRP